VLKALSSARDCHRDWLGLHEGAAGHQLIALTPDVDRARNLFAVDTESDTGFTVFAGSLLARSASGASPSGEGQSDLPANFQVRRYRDSNIAKTLLELNTCVSTNWLHSSLASSASMAPTSAHQLSTSCCPASSTSFNDVERQAP